ncbi:MAG: VOC family protein [Chloroflexi bacterium]|nr:VOC family protein [Chloroflexota bacterium]PKB57093.1 MAG: glyoxalase [SAR202 cluster bacterium Casp-Chloro-G3]
MTVQNISAITLAVQDMSRSVGFYQGIVELHLLYGGPDADFTSFKVGDGYLNLIQSTEGERSWWGRVIFYVDDVDELHRRLVDAGEKPTTTPRDAPWRERYFHVNDPDGHELSFARPLDKAD